MLRLKQLRVQGFRGYSGDGEIIEFATPAVLICGDNHQGKSSLLNAIEWCLYGDQCIGLKSGIRERVGGWEIVNRNASEARVDLVIETAEGETSISRIEPGQRGTGGKHVEVRMPNGSVLNGDQAEKAIADLVGLSFRDFSTTVYQHQETIRHIVIQTPKERNDAIDRLLGLSDYQSVLEGLKKSPVRDLEKEQRGYHEQLAARIEQALALRRGDLREKKDEAITSGLDTDELTPHKLLDKSGDVCSEIGEFAEELGVAAKQLTLPSGWTEFPSFRSEAREQLDHLWSESPDVKEQSQLNKRRTKADSLKAEYDRHKQDVSAAERELGGFEQLHGDKGQIGADIESVRASISTVDEEIGQVSPKAQLIQEGITVLETAAPSVRVDLCPLCGSQVPDLLTHLKTQWVEEIESQVQDLQTERDALEERQKELEELETRHIELTSEVDEARERMDATTDSAAEFLQTELTAQDDPAALLKAEIEKASARLESMEAAMQGKRDTLNRIARALTQLDLLHDVLTLEEKINDIEKIAQTDEYRELDRIMEESAQLVVDVQFLADLVRGCMREEAEGRMGDAKDAIDDYFQRIVGNPGIEELYVQIEEDKRTGGNSYKFCDQNGLELNPVLSQGDLNGLALSIFLGLVEAYSHPVGFVLLDDPSQSLGTLQKQRLAGVLDSVCQGGRNIVVATMDAELEDYLRKDLTKAKTVYRLGNWVPESGPEISSRS